jgi:hypothetical protein
LKKKRGYRRSLTERGRRKRRDFARSRRKNVVWKRKRGKPRRRRGSSNSK